MITTTGYAFSPVMKKSLHATLVKFCTSVGDQLSHSYDGGVVVRKILHA
jgi:hypothetical protein